jgi:hypothetical protein
MNRFDPLPCILAFLAGAIIPVPGYLIVLVGWVPALQASILLSSLACLLASSSPWWVDWLQGRQADRDADAYFSSENFREEQRFHASEARGWTSTDLDA